MSTNRGKLFETRFKSNWEECFPGGFLMRLHDQVSGFKTVSQNCCDFIAFVKGHLFLMECKSHDGKSIDFGAMPQYGRLLAYRNMDKVHAGFVI